MAEEIPNCGVCGEPMPPSETMFKYHGYSGPCPKPPLPKKFSYDSKCEELARHFLGDTDIPEAMVPSFAQDIQDCVEAFIQRENQRSSTD